MSIPQKDKRGGTLFLVTIFMIALFAFAALAIDVGNVYRQRARIQDAIDAGSLAAVRSWAGGKLPSEVVDVGKTFSTTNGSVLADI